MDSPYDRLNRWIDQLQADHHPDVLPAADPAEVEVFITAAAWAGLRPGADEPDPAFLARLRAQLALAPPLPPTEPVPASARIVPPDAGPVPEAAATMVGGTAPPQHALAPREARWWAAVAPVLTLPFDRRSLLTQMGTLAAGFVAGLGLEWLFTRTEVATIRDETAHTTGALRALHGMLGTSVTKHGVLPASQGKWFAVARLADMQVGQAIPVTMGACKGFLLRTDTRQFSALSAICTHLGCELQWHPDSRSLHCPCHGSAYDTTGHPVAGPALYPGPIGQLPLYSWKIAGDTVYVLA